MLRIYHNNRCSKSRSALQILQEKQLDFEIVYYLENPPSFEELQQLIHKLGLRAEDLIRKNEAVFKENYKNTNFSETEWTRLLCEHPNLIERPIVETETAAVVARPPEILEAFLNKKEHGA